MWQRTSIQGSSTPTVPRYGEILTVVAMAIPFAPPFVSVFALGNMMFPARDGSKLPDGVMGGFRYSQNANRRWQIVVAAGICGASNCLFLMMALLVATGN